MPKQSFNSKEIIRLLSELKSETPEYPSKLLEARKVAFLKQAATLKIQGKGPGGEGGQQGGSSGSGGSGAALGGGTAAQGFVLQALVGFSVVAALLLTAFAYREQIGEILQNRREVVAISEIKTVTAEWTASPVPTVSPSFTGSPTAGIATPTGTGLEAINGEGLTIIDGTLCVDGTLVLEGTTVIEGTLVFDGTPVGTKANSGLHLGQTPGTPAAPGQGNPGNPNQPDQPAKPTKVDNPNKPQTTKNPGKTK